MLLFLLCCKASQISKMQKRIRLSCPNWTRKTLNNVAHLFLVILNGTQKNGHNRPCHRARSHFCRRRCSPHLWRLLRTLRHFAKHFFTFFIMLFNVCFHFHTFKKLINPLFVFTSKRAAGIASDPHKFIPLEEPTAQQWRPFALTNNAPPNVAARSYVRPCSA